MTASESNWNNFSLLVIFFSVKRYKNIPLSHIKKIDHSVEKEKWTCKILLKTFVGISQMQFENNNELNVP